ncbi:MAG: ABC transporter permease [Cellulophaga sp.]
MYKLFKKDLKLFLRDKRSVFLTFLLPILLISLFAFAFGGIGNSTNSAKPIALLVADVDQTPKSKKLISKLDSLDGLRLILSDLKKSKTQVRKGKYAAVLVIHKGYKDSLFARKNPPVELWYDEAKEMEIGMLQHALISTLMSEIGKQNAQQNIKTYLNKQFPAMDSNLRNTILEDAVKNNENNKASFSSKSVLKLTSISGDTKENRNLGLIQAVSGTAILMLLFSVAGLGTSILEEKENGTIKRLLFSPIKGSTILYGKMLFAFFIAVVQLTTMFLFSWVAFSLDLSMNIPALILMILATSFAVSSFGIFLAAISKTRKQAESLSTLIILVMSAVGGSMIPLFIMPVIMQKIAVFSLNYWGIQGFYDIFWRALPLVDILPRIGVLVGIGLFMTLISMQFFKRNILKLI